MTAKQVFKNRSDAFSYLLSKGAPIGQAKFYMDAKAYGLIQKDKSILLCDLLSYVEKHLKIDILPQQSDTDLAESRKQELEALKLREKRAKVGKLELEQRAHDERYILRDFANTQMAALVGKLKDTFRHHLYINQSRLATGIGADHSRGPELFDSVDAIMAKAFNEVAEHGMIETEEEVDE